MRKKVDMDIDYLRKLGYESRDVPLRSILMAGVGLFVLLVGSALVTGLIYALLVPPQPIPKAPRLPVGQPALQPNPRKDLKTLLAEEEARLKSYGWVDQRAGVVRIPIDRAIELTAGRGLPVREQPAASGGSGLSKEGE